MANEHRRANRVAFTKGYLARIVSIDGTWQRRCVVENVSNSGARLQVELPLEGLVLDEFFLLLSQTGQASRRCRKVWLRGDEIGVRFLRQEAAPTRARGSTVVEIDA